MASGTEEDVQPHGSGEDPPGAGTATHSLGFASVGSSVGPVHAHTCPSLQVSRSGILDDAFGWLSMQRRPPFPSPVCGRDAFALAACQARVSGIRQGVFLLIIGSQ